MCANIFYKLTLITKYLYVLMFILLLGYLYFNAAVQLHEESQKVADSSKEVKKLAAVQKVGESKHRMLSRSFCKVDQGSRYSVAMLK